MESIYFLSLLALVAQIVRKQVWRILPCFTASVIAATVFEIAYQPYSALWTAEWFAWLVVPLLCFRVLALAESVIEHSGGLPYRGALLTTAGLFAAFFASIIVWRFTPADTVLNVVQIRRAVTIGCAAYAGVYILLLRIDSRWERGFLSRHVDVMFLSWGTFAASSVLRLACPAGCWESANTVFYTAHTLINLLWILQLQVPRDSRVVTLQPARSIFGSLS
jgi:hypothetical protein